MSKSMSITSTILLENSEAQIPILGFGVYQISPKDTKEVCRKALPTGYRHIDTAQLYNNEKEVGEAVQQSGIPREEIFLTTKIRYPRLGKGKTYKCTLDSVKKLDPREDGYVDLFLIHSPHVLKPKERKELWLALEKLHEEGRARAIGVSNYQVEHLEELKEYATVWPPAVNQILLHPWTQQRDTVDYCKEHGIILEAFCPLTKGQRLNDPLVVEIAKKTRKSTAQVLIRYSLQKGWVPLPKSERKKRMKENSDVFDFEISAEDMTLLDNCDRNTGPMFE